MTSSDVESLNSSNSKKEKIKTMLFTAAGTGGQHFYFNYTNLVAVKIGATPLQMSFITAIQNLGSALLQGFFGKLSDRLGRKIILTLGYIIATITTIYLATISSPIIFMVVIAIYSLGISMVTPTWNALMGDISTEKNRARVISLYGMVGTLASSIVLLVLGFLVDKLPLTTPVLENKYRTMVFIGSFFFAFATIVVITLTETNIVKKNRKPLSFRALLSNRSLVVFTGITMIWWFVMSFLWPLSPFVLERLNPGSGQIAILSAIFSANIALAQWIAGKTANKMGRRYAIFLGFFLLCFVPVILAYSTQWWMIIFANLFGGLGNGFMIVALNTEILNLASPETKGMLSGTYNLFSGIFTFSGSFLSGIIFDSLTKNVGDGSNEFYSILRIMLISITAIRFVATIPMFILARKTHKTKKDKTFRNS